MNWLRQPRAIQRELTRLHRHCAVQYSKFRCDRRDEEINRRIANEGTYRVSGGLVRTRLDKEADTHFANHGKMR